MCNLMNTVKPPFFSIISSLYELWQPSKMIWSLGKDSSSSVSARHKISVFPSTILCKSPNLFPIELLFRLKRWFYSDGNVTGVHGGINILLVARTSPKRINKRARHICSVCSVLYAILFSVHLKLLFAKVQFPA